VNTQQLKLTDLSTFYFLVSKFFIENSELHIDTLILKSIIKNPIDINNFYFLEKRGEIPVIVDKETYNYYEQSKSNSSSTI